MSAGSAGFPTHLIREDLRDFTGYSSARTSAAARPAHIWLNANESAEASAADPDGSVRRYPDPQPAAFIETLARHYGVPTECVIAGRGSDEIIELLIRGLCRPGGDAIVVAPPTFGMYAVSARLHGVPVHEVRQRELGVDATAGQDSDNGSPRWQVDVTQVARTAREAGARLVFIASPGNPTGATVAQDELRWLVEELADQAVVVVDEAYIEFAQTASAAQWVGQLPTLAVLRTLSKAHGLAGARIGVGLLHPELRTLLGRVQAPYPLPVPVTQMAMRALSDEGWRATQARITRTLQARERLQAILASSPVVTEIFASEANFLLLRSTDPDLMLARLADAGIVVRDMRAHIDDAIRVTVGNQAQLDELAAALGHDGHD